MCTDGGRLGCNPGCGWRGGQGARRRPGGLGAGQAGRPATPSPQGWPLPPRPLARLSPAQTWTGSSLHRLLLLKGGRKLGAAPVPRPPPDCPPPGPRRTSPGRSSRGGGREPGTSEPGGCLESPRAGLLCAHARATEPGRGQGLSRLGAGTQGLRTVPASVGGRDSQVKDRACFTFCPQRMRTGRGALAYCGAGGRKGEDAPGDRLPRSFKDDLQTSVRLACPLPIQPLIFQTRVSCPDREGALPSPRRDCAASAASRPRPFGLRFPMCALGVCGRFASAEPVWADVQGKAAGDLRSPVFG